jgi:L-asparagine transporter-like permease
MNKIQLIAIVIFILLSYTMYDTKTPEQRERYDDAMKMISLFKIIEIVGTLLIILYVMSFRDKDMSFIAKKFGGIHILTTVIVVFGLFYLHHQRRTVEKK